jgi:hypothetical protein
MTIWLRRYGALSSLLLAICFFHPNLPAQTIENFNWLDMRQPAAGNIADVEAIVSRALVKEPYTALCEIGFIGIPTKEEAAEEKAAAAASASAGSTSPKPLAPRLPVPRDAHLLVITSQRANPAALPDEDVYSVYDVDQRQIAATLLLRGPGLRLLGWLRMWREGNPELVSTYNDCTVCQRTTFFTTFYVDGKTHQWQARWPRARAGAPIFSEGQEANGGDQIYGLLDDEAGRVVLGTWAHYPGRGRSDSDFVYEYRVDSYGTHESAEPLAGMQARVLQQRLCRGQGVLFGLGGGQDSTLCHALVGASAPPLLETRRRRRAQ